MQHFDSYPFAKKSGYLFSHLLSINNALCLLPNLYNISSSDQYKTSAL